MNWIVFWFRVMDCRNPFATNFFSSPILWTNTLMGCNLFGVLPLLVLPNFWVNSICSLFICYSSDSCTAISTQKNTTIRKWIRSGSILAPPCLVLTLNSDEISEIGLRPSSFGQNILLSANVKRSQPLLLIPFWLSSLKVLNKFGHSDWKDTKGY